MKKHAFVVRSPHLIEEFGFVTIKSRLMSRFVVARNILGWRWQKILGDHDVFFTTAEGCRCISQTAQAVSDPFRGHVDNVERVVLAMEKIIVKRQLLTSVVIDCDGEGNSIRPCIRGRLLCRFVAARKILGKRWRAKLAAFDPFFESGIGLSYATTTARAISVKTHGNVDRIERVVVAMEKIVGIEVKSVV